MAEKKKSDTTLPWEYCECGCHGHSVRIGTTYYWMYNDLRGNFDLYDNTRWHGWLGDKLGRYSSFKKADRAARENAKPKIRKLHKELSEAYKMLKH